MVGVDVDIVDDHRFTPLHVACREGHLTCVQVLLQAQASTTLRNNQVYNCLETAIVCRHTKVVKELLTHARWREMMRNAQPIEKTVAFDTPMRKLIRYIPDVAVWFIDTRLTTVAGGPGQKTYKHIYDYEFYEDIREVRSWYQQGTFERQKDCASIFFEKI